MKAYIETVFNKPAPEWLHTAQLGLYNKGFEIIKINKTFISSIPCNKQNIFVGGVEATVDYFQLNDIDIPKPLNIPVELHKNEFLGRSLRLMTMGEFRSIFKRLPIVDTFVKPYSRVKAFPSGIIDKISTMELAYSDVDGDEIIQTSSAIDFISEYRCFIHNGEIKGINFYKGDLTIFPHISSIKNMIRVYKEAPVAYTLDVGIVQENGNWGLKENRTLLVECNDMWSVDNYGLNSRDYSTMLRDRWFEILNKNKNGKAS